MQITAEIKILLFRLHYKDRFGLPHIEYLNVVRSVLKDHVERRIKAVRRTGSGLVKLIKLFHLHQPSLSFF